MVAIQHIDAILQGKLDPAQSGQFRATLGQLLGFVCVCGVGYGTVMGSFGGMDGDRSWQVLFSAAKVPILLLGTFILCLPSFFVLNTLAGLRADFRQVLQALLTGQAAMTIVLCSLAPFTVVWYASSANYHAAVLFNGLAFGLASLVTQATVHRLYQPLFERSPKHRTLFRVWLAHYIFVGIQMGWLLRPFIGQPASAVELFRPEMWGNAYVEILHHCSGLLFH